jgi:hypothetical protein
MDTQFAQMTNSSHAERIRQEILFNPNRFASEEIVALSSKPSLRQELRTINNQLQILEH